MDLENKKQIDYILSSRINTFSNNTGFIRSNDIRKKEFTNVDNTLRNEVLATASNFSFLQKNVRENNIIGFNSRELRKNI